MILYSPELCFVKKKSNKSFKSTARGKNNSSIFISEGDEATLRRSHCWATGGISIVHTATAVAKSYHLPRSSARCKFRRIVELYQTEAIRWPGRAERGDILLPAFLSFICHLASFGVANQWAKWLATRDWQFRWALYTVQSCFCSSPTRIKSC